MEYKGYSAKIEYSHEDNVFFGTIQGIVDLITFEATSVDELNAAFIEAVDDYLDICEREGKEPEKAYKGTFNVRIAPELHRRAAIKAVQSNMSLNQYVELAISKAVNAEKGNDIFHDHVRTQENKYYITINERQDYDDILGNWITQPLKLRGENMPYGRA